MLVVSKMIQTYPVIMLLFCTKHSKLTELECLSKAKELLMGEEVKGQEKPALANAWQRFFRRLKLSQKQGDFREFIGWITTNNGVDPVVRRAYLNVKNNKVIGRKR